MSMYLEPGMADVVTGDLKLMPMPSEVERLFPAVFCKPLPVPGSHCTGGRWVIRDQAPCNAAVCEPVKKAGGDGMLFLLVALAAGATLLVWGGDL